MPVIQIREAQRENARLVVGLVSTSGDGKTWTALQLAYGLANFNAKKVGLLDAENRRGSLYSDCLQKSTRPTTERFLIGDLHAPFTPQRYIDSIHEFQATGIEVLIIDSTSHEWEGTGGCQEIAEAGNPKIPNWNLAKKEHKRFMNAMLQCDMHIIVCVRAREKTKPEKIDGKLQFVEMGLQPIQEKNFMFEMTASLLLQERGTQQKILKCPDQLLNILGRGNNYITSDDGKALRDWVDGALKLDPGVEKFRNRLLSNTEGGVTHIEDCWGKTPAAVREALGEAFHGTLVASAREYDSLKAEAERVAAEEGGGTQTSGPAGDAGTAQEIAARGRRNAPPPATTATPAEAATVVTPATAAQPVVAPAAKAPLPAAAAPASRQEPAKAPQQQSLAPAVTGVLDSDPVF